MSDFKQINNLWFWCQKVLPLVYDDSISYYEVLCKMSEYLNRVINNVNALPGLIDDKIKEYISSGEIENVLNEMLQNYFPIDVKNPPADLAAAVGDGTTDDTAALQNIINYAAEHNLPMIFPAGVYRVSSLTIAEEAHFLGVGNPTIFKLNNTEDALINVEGSFTAFGMTFNANIAGVVNPVDAITGACDNVSLSNCVVTGCVSGVDASVSGIMQIVNCKFSNYTDYAVHAEGTGRLFVDGVEVESVANSGAMRFIRIDTSNSYVENLTSLISVPIGVEITGNNNTINATIPNCETPINDGGTNNSYNISGRVKKLSTENYTENVAAESVENVGTKKEITATDIWLNPENPLTYKEPTQSEGELNYITFKDPNGNVYAIPTTLVDNIKNLGYKTFKTIYDFGATGDGVTNDTAAFINALQSNDAVFIPAGSYFCNEIDASSYENIQSCFISGGNINFTNKTPLEIPKTYGTIFRTTESDVNPYKNYIVGIFENTGGTRGNVQSPMFVQSIVREATSNFIWGIVSSLKVEGNLSNDAEHAGLYSQIISDLGDTGMWALCGDIQNDKPGGNPTASKIGLELTFRAAESDNNNMRVGMHLAFNPSPGATGAQMFAGLFLSGRFGHEGPSTDMKYGLCLNSIDLDRLIGADISKGGQVRVSIGIDFTNIAVRNSAINLDRKILQFGVSNAQESADGNLNFNNPSGNISLNANAVNVAGNMISKGIGSGAPSGEPVGHIPITIDGSPFKIPIYSA